MTKETINQPRQLSWRITCNKLAPHDYYFVPYEYLIIKLFDSQLRIDYDGKLVIIGKIGEPCRQSIIVMSAIVVSRIVPDFM